MKSIAVRMLIGLGVLVAVAAVGWQLIGGVVGLAEARLPEFPDWPEPLESLEADSAGEIYFASHSPYDFDILLRTRPLPVPTTGFGILILPETASPATKVPAVILAHGSGGITPGREMRVARILADQGFAVFVIDYYAPRGVTPESDYMSKVFAVTEFDAVADAYGALRIISTHPAIDGDRIGLMGFSYGGMAVRIAMDERVRKALVPDRAGFAAFVDVYGPCFQDWGTTQTNGAPLLTLRGTADASNDLEACAEREAALRAIGVPVDARLYEGAGHAWESETPRRLFEDSPYVSGCTIRYDELGHSWIDETRIVSGAPDESRAERVVQRISSGGPMAGCVGYGYLIGRDDQTFAKARAAFVPFLRAALGVDDDAE